jgi:hypothetical protein
LLAVAPIVVVIVSYIVWTLIYSKAKLRKSVKIQKQIIEAGDSIATDEDYKEYEGG